MNRLLRQPGWFWLACEEAIMQQATLVTSILQSTTAFFIENETLRLAGPNGDLVFTRGA